MCECNTRRSELRNERDAALALLGRKCNELDEVQTQLETTSRHLRECRSLADELFRQLEAAHQAQLREVDRARWAYGSGPGTLSGSDDI